MKSKIYILTLVIGLVIISGQASAEEVKNISLSVSRNDSLIEICRKYLKKPAMWPLIAKNNRLANPDKLSPGQKIIIPVDMLKSYPMDGRITFIQGKASSRNNFSDWTALKLNDLVKVGSSLKTEADSAVEVSFEDGTAFTMRENTLLSVKTAQNGILHVLRVIYVETGKVISRVKAATGRDSRFEIETPSALAAARGTEYRVGVDESKTTRAEMLENSIDVKAMGITVVLHEGEGSFTRKDEPPSPPFKLLLPPKLININPQYDDHSLEFKFTKIENAASYRVMLSKDREGKNFVKTAAIRPDGIFGVKVPGDGKYYLIVSSFDGNGLEGLLSQPEEIIVSKKIQQPAIVVPVENAKLLDVPIKVQWQQISISARYQLQISAERGFVKTIVDVTGLSTTTYQSKKMDVGQYFLRLRTVQDDGQPGEWSAVRQFTVSEPPLPEIIKLSGDGKHLSLEWAALPGAASYLLQIATDKDFKEILLSEKLLQPKLIYDKQLQPGKYYVRVCGINSDNNAGSFSKSADFEIGKDKNYVMEIIGTAGLILLLFLL